MRQQAAAKTLVLTALEPKQVGTHPKWGKTTRALEDGMIAWFYLQINNCRWPTFCSFAKVQRWRAQSCSRWRWRRKNPQRWTWPCRAPDAASCDWDGDAWCFPLKSGKYPSDWDIYGDKWIHDVQAIVQQVTFIHGSAFCFQPNDLIAVARSCSRWDHLPRQGSQSWQPQSQDSLGLLIMGFQSLIMTSSTRINPLSQKYSSSRPGKGNPVTTCHQTPLRAPCGSPWRARHRSRGQSVASRPMADWWGRSTPATACWDNGVPLRTQRLVNGSMLVDVSGKSSNSLVDVSGC